MMTMSSSIRVKPLSLASPDSCAPEFRDNAQTRGIPPFLVGLAWPVFVHWKEEPGWVLCFAKMPFLANRHDNPVIGDISSK